MFRLSRITLVGFLSLMQCVAPLVHAHSGTTPAQGVLHLPGLEFLASKKADTGFASMTSRDNGQYGVIVAVAAGICHEQNLVRPPPDRAFLPPTRLGLTDVCVRKGGAVHRPARYTAGLPAYSLPSPRAPPRPDA
jgi:hypothetical protein